jgi:soluble cytochrome b562
LDLQLLQQGKLEEAQKAKEEIEELQRRDVKLREKYGPKK